MADVNFTDFAFAINATGAVARTMPDRLTDQINVMEFGADPSGGALTDNRTAFEAAIAAATPTWPGAGTKAAGRIYIPRGLYNFLGPLELLPDLTAGTFNSFTITGEALGCTKLLGNFNGYILDMGEEEIEDGGFIIEQLHVMNSNTTPFTSGAIRMGGICPTVRSCQLGGMVQANFTGAKAPAIRDTFIGGSLDHPPGEGNIGVLFAGDGGVVENCQGSYLDISIALSGTGQSVHGCHFENCRRVIVTGFTAGGIGLGYSRGVSVQSQSCEGCAIALDIAGPTVGSFTGIGGQMHQTPDVNPDPDSDFPDRCKWTVRIQDDCAEGLQIIQCNGSTADLVDPTGGLYYIGMPPDGFIRTGGAWIFGAQDNTLGGRTADQNFTLPGSAGGGSAVAGAANCARLVRSTRALVWQYDDLPWGTLVGASVSGTTLSYSSATRLTLEEGAVLSGTGVTPGTKVTEILTSTTASVTPSQTASSTTMTFYCNNPGDEYTISDSVDPLWTGSASNAGKPVVGGGAELVSISFKETDGYVIVG
jgi:hypothetical protein